MTRKRLVRRVVLVALAVALTATTASATPNFPSAISSDLGLSYSPKCALCHTDGNGGGRGTVNTPFGTNARADGLVAYDTTSLQQALDTMAADGTDSDGDCIPDVTELKNGTDPNVADSGETCAVSSTSALTPEYGCAIVSSASTHSDEGVWALLPCAWVVASCHRRARSRRRAHGRGDRETQQGGPSWNTRRAS